jgi:hypothetical protein
VRRRARHVCVAVRGGGLEVKCVCERTCYKKARCSCWRSLLCPETWTDGFRLQSDSTLAPALSDLSCGCAHPSPHAPARPAARMPCSWDMASSVALQCLRTPERERGGPRAARTQGRSGGGCCRPTVQMWHRLGARGARTGIVDRGEVSLTGRCRVSLVPCREAPRCVMCRVSRDTLRCA